MSAAAQQWQVDAASCHAQAGQCHPRGEQSQHRLWSNWSRRLPKLPAPQNVPLKNPKDFKIIGTAVEAPRFRRRKWTAPRCSASTCACPTWSTRPSRTVRCSGGTLASVDDTNAKKIPGVRQVVEDRQRGGRDRRSHVGRQTRAAGARHQVERRRGREAVDEADRRRSRPTRRQRNGAVAAQGRRRGARVFEREDACRCDLPAAVFLAHATMEPINCTVHVRAGQLRGLASLAVPTRVRDAAMAVTGLPADKIIVHHHSIGGGLRAAGSNSTWLAQAVKIAKQCVDAREGAVDARRRHSARHVPPVLLRQDLRRSRRERQAARVAAPHRWLVDPRAFRAARVQERARPRRGRGRVGPAVRLAEPARRLRAPRAARYSHRVLARRRSHPHVRGGEFHRRIPRPRREVDPSNTGAICSARRRAR